MKRFFSPGTRYWRVPRRPRRDPQVVCKVVCGVDDHGIIDALCACVIAEVLTKL
jgi:hypothetical protein